MNHPTTVKRIVTSVFTLLAVLLILNGCGSSPDLATQISGKWQRDQGEGTIDINLAGNPKTVTVDDHTYTAVVEHVDQGMFTVKVKVETEAGKSEVWSLTQRWNDNGSAFNLAFRHNGTTDTLIPLRRS